MKLPVNPVLAALAVGIAGFFVIRSGGELSGKRKGDTPFNAPGSPHPKMSVPVAMGGDAGTNTTEPGLRGVRRDRHTGRSFKIGGLGGVNDVAPLVVVSGPIGHPVIIV